MTADRYFPDSDTSDQYINVRARSSVSATLWTPSNPLAATITRTFDLHQIVSARNSDEVHLYAWTTNRDYVLAVRAIGNSRFKNAKFPCQRKNSRKFPFGKMLDFARSSAISTETSNIYWNQLQFAICRSVQTEVLSLESAISPAAFHPSHMSRLTGSDRSQLSEQTPSPCLDRRLPDTKCLP